MKKTLAAILVAAGIFLSGCAGGSIYSNYRRTEHLLLVQALGADTDGENITLSVSCAKPAKESAAAIISRSGESILAAMSSLQGFTADSELYYSHGEYVLMGEDYARRECGELFDFLARDNQLRLGIYLFVAKDATAKELITGAEEADYEISKTLAGIRRATDKQGAGRVFTARETLRSLSVHGAALICAISAQNTEDSVFMVSPGVTAVADGYGILKDGLLVGYLDRDLSQAANLILGHLGSEGPTIPDGRGGKLSIQYEKGSAKITPHWKADGSLDYIEIKGKIKASLAEPHTDTLHITDKELLKQLEEALSEDMVSRLGELLELSRSMDADFLGLKSHLKGLNGEKAAALGENWLGEATFRISCQSDIQYTRELGDKMNPRGQG